MLLHDTTITWATTVSGSYQLILCAFVIVFTVFLNLGNVEVSSALKQAYSMPYGYM